MESYVIKFQWINRNRFQLLIKGRVSLNYSNRISLLERKTIQKVNMRIIPFMFLLYIIAYLDRINISFAALQMNKDLALSSQAFGILSGIFFISYFLFEVPSNILIQRYGARIGIARILILWGICSVLTGFAQNAIQLYILRFLLGAAEAGFFPGILWYLNIWFRSKELATANAYFQMAIPVSFIIGGPLSTWIMDHIHLMGLHGWRWMLIFEGVPAVVFGLISYFYLTDRPEDAHWLSSEEKNWLITALREDKASKKEIKHLSTWKALTDPKILFLSVLLFLGLTGSLGVSYWMPQIIKGLSHSLTNTQVGMISTIPYIVSAFGMIYWSRRSDKSGERKIHTALAFLVSGIGLLGAGFTDNPFVSMAFITLAQLGMNCVKGPFYALPSLFLSESTYGVAIAIISSLGNLGGFLGPYLLGFTKDVTGSTKAGLVVLSILLILAFAMTMLMRLEKNGTRTGKESITHSI
jgi:ACS family tartrate transporter-like MFS transporter